MQYSDNYSTFRVYTSLFQNMKIRIQGQSIRFRLNKTDIANFEKYGSITQFIQIGPDPSEILYYSLSLTENSEYEIHYLRNKIELTIPKNICLDWFKSELVGFDHYLTINSELKLYLLIEKDFQCLVPRPNENEVDNFINPLSNNNC